MPKNNYQKKKKNFLKFLVKEYLSRNKSASPADIYERMDMDKNTFYSYLREGKNSSPESWPTFIKGLEMNEDHFYELAKSFFK
jgi:hypothetical protein